MNTIKYKLTSKPLNSKKQGLLMQAAFNYQKAALSKFLLPFKLSFLLSETIDKATKAQSIPKLNLIDCNSAEANAIPLLTTLLATGGIYRFLNTLNYIYPARIIRDYSLALRGRKLRLLDALALLIGISFLNADRKDGRHL